MSFIKICKGEYYNSDAIERLFEYCMGKCEYWGGFGIRTDSIRSAMFDMKQVKKFAGKEGGKQLYHMIVSINYYRVRYDKRETANSWCRLIAIEISKRLYDLGYQNAYFKHNNNGNLHLHFIINSVNFMTGKKLSGSQAIANFITNYAKKEYPFLQWEGSYYV